MAEELNESKPTSISDVLGARSPQPSPEPTPSPATPAVSVSETESTPAAVASEAPAPEVAPPAKSPETGLLKATITERRKRQELEQQNALLQQQLAQYQTYQPTYEEPALHVPDLKQVEDKYDAKLLGITEFYARQAHPDFDEKLAAFSEAVGVPGTPTFNKALYESVLVNSDNPAEAAYQAGVQLQFQKKYGNDLTSQMSGIRKEVESELRQKIRAEIEAEFVGKIAQKNNQPTNILQGRAVSSGDADRAPLGLRDLLASKRKR